MLKAYIDGSGKGAKDVLVLAGYIATVEQWAGFSNEWDAMLKTGSPPKRYSKVGPKSFKMKEMKDDLAGCALYYGIIEKHVTAAVSCMVKTSDLVEAVKEFPWPFKFDKSGTEKLENPYYFGFKAIMDKLAQNQSQLKIDEPINFIFDEEGEKKRCIEGWDRMKYSSSANVRRLLGDTPIYRDDKTTLPLQAADLYAWWVRNWELQGVNEAIATLPFPWEKKRDIPRMEIRFEKRDFIQEFQRWCDDPETVRRVLRSDEEVSRETNELREWDYSQMMPEEGKTDQTNNSGSELDSVKASSFVKLYANSVQIESTLFDFKLIFGEIVRADGKMAVEQTAAVVMSPQHAKILSRLLARNVRQYEERIGQINLPAEPTGT